MDPGSKQEHQLQAEFQEKTPQKPDQSLPTTPLANTLFGGKED